MATGKSFRLAKKAHSADLEELVDHVRDPCHCKFQGANAVRSCEMADALMCYNSLQLSVVGKVVVNFMTILDQGSSSLSDSM